MFLEKKNQHSKKKNLFKDILLNSYGNYTIFTIMKKAFKHPNDKYIEYFLKVFNENIGQLKKINFGKKFINKVE